MQKFVLRELLIDSKDGEWGKGESTDGLVEMLVIRGTDFEAVRIGQIDNIPKRFILDRIASRKKLTSQDIIIETAGGSKDRTTGRTLILKDRFFNRVRLPVTCASFARFLRIDQAKANPAYIFWLLQAMYESRQLARYHTQHTGVARYQFTTFADNEPLYLPNITIQRRIASILSTYDDLIENNTRRIAILEEMARRIYEEWFVKFKFPGHEKVKMVDSELGKIPEGWKVRRLEELYKTASGGTPSRKQPEYFGGSINWVKTQELQDGFIFSSEEKITEKGLSNSSAKLFPKGTVLVAMYGATIGQLAILGDTAATNQACCAIIPSISEFGTAYVFLTLKIRRSELIDLRAGAAQQNINQIVIKNFKMLQPPKGIICIFNSYIEPLLDLIAISQLKNINLRTTRDFLLPKLISGEIDVSKLPEPEEAAA